MKYTVRLREIAFYEFEVEADSYKAAFNLVNIATKGSLPNKSVGTRFEIESITLGGENAISKNEHRS